MIYVPNSIWDISNRIWNTVGFGTPGVLNLIMFQINIGMFGTWLDFGFVIPNPTMFQINIGMFKAWLVWHTCIPNPNMPMLIWDMVRFETLNVPNMTCSKST